MHLSCLLCTVQPREGSVMIWGCFSKPDLGSATLGGQKQWGQVTRSGSNVKECLREHEASFPLMGVSLSLLSSKQDVGEKLMQLCLEIINVMTSRTCMKIWKLNVVQKMIECLPPPILLLITNVPSFLLLSSFLTGLCFQVSLSLPHMHIFKKMCLICTMMRHNRKEKLDTSVCSKHDSLSSGFFLFIYLFK